MNIALIGYGKMAREVEVVAKENGMHVSAIITRAKNSRGTGITPDVLKGVDVCIDFSSPDSVLDNINAVAECGKNIVVGTTGWYDALEHVKALAVKKKIGVLYATNFSLGLNIFSQIVKEASRVFDRYADYDVAIREAHHKNKADSPSGTALSLGAIVLQHVKRKTEILGETAHGPIKPHQLHIASTRVGGVVGAHSVLFDSECDSIELVHTAKSRRGFALGAVVAARWLKGRQGMFTMSDVIAP